MLYNCTPRCFKMSHVCCTLVSARACTCACMHARTHHQPAGVRRRCLCGADVEPSSAATTAPSCLLTPAVRASRFDQRRERRPAVVRDTSRCHASSIRGARRIPPSHALSLSFAAYTHRSRIVIVVVVVVVVVMALTRTIASRLVGLTDAAFVLARAPRPATAAATAASCRVIAAPRVSLTPPPRVAAWRPCRYYTDKIIALTNNRVCDRERIAAWQCRIRRMMAYATGAVSCGRPALWYIYIFFFNNAHRGPAHSGRGGWGGGGGGGGSERNATFPAQP